MPSFIRRKKNEASLSRPQSKQGCTAQRRGGKLTLPRTILPSDPSQATILPSDPADRNINSAFSVPIAQPKSNHNLPMVKIWARKDGVPKTTPRKDDQRPPTAERLLMVGTESQLATSESRVATSPRCHRALRRGATLAGSLDDMPQLGINLRAAANAQPQGTAANAQPQGTAANTQPQGTAGRLTARQHAMTRFAEPLRLDGTEHRAALLSFPSVAAEHPSPSSPLSPCSASVVESHSEAESAAPTRSTSASPIRTSNGPMASRQSEWTRHGTCSRTMAIAVI